MPFLGPPEQLGRLKSITPAEDFWETLLGNPGVREWILKGGEKPEVTVDPDSRMVWFGEGTSKPRETHVHAQPVRPRPRRVPDAVHVRKGGWDETYFQVLA